MQSPIRSCTDRVFLNLAEEFETLKTKEKVHRLLEHGADREGSLSPVTQQIDGKTYVFGFAVKREDQAQGIARILHDVLKEQKLEESSNAFAVRLLSCKTKHEQIVLLEQEIKQQREFLEGVNDTYLG